LGAGLAACFTGLFEDGGTSDCALAA